MLPHRRLLCTAFSVACCKEVDWLQSGPLFGLLSLLHAAKRQIDPNLDLGLGSWAQRGMACSGSAAVLFFADKGVLMRGSERGRCKLFCSAFDIVAEVSMLLLLFKSSMQSMDCSVFIAFWECAAFALWNHSLGVTGCDQHPHI